jgi:DNA polymerase-3 subunit epsilon
MFYDFETNGLPLFNEPSEDPRQPHIVQVCACLVDAETREMIRGVDAIIRPDGWVIPDEVAKLHGITTERALAEGQDERGIVDWLHEVWQQADLRVAHNESFDARIMRIALKRFHGDEAADAWKAGKSACTARLSTPILKLAPTDKMLAAGRRHHKTANLSEAYEFFIGKPFENAHTADADVGACMAVYWAIQDGQCEALRPSSKEIAT